ncbi:MAG: phosphoadenosine phosphosulfate reductase family protein [Aquidulcibacter sp.]|jgi:3'-phosphoadenosine 5'-phosphosulfate sulfotransferase (PAPS reductase)/FAD synthetase
MADPFKIDGPTCISFSGGRTSAYMLWRVLQANGGLPEEAKVCFANTGKEEEATLRFVDRCSKEWNVPITWVEYRDAEQTKDRFAVVTFETASRNGEPFEAIIRKRNYLPNPVSRFCTVEMKVRAIHRYLKSIGWTEWDSMLGIRADEQRRLAKIGNQDYGKHEEKIAPLGRVGVTKEMVGEFWRSQSFDLELPNMNGVTMHGNCDLCYLKGGAQILSLIQEKPERAIWWAKMEALALASAPSGARFRTDRPSYAEMAKFAAEQRDMFDKNEEAIACFCGD